VSQQNENKAIVGRWLTELSAVEVIDELAPTSGPSTRCTRRAIGCDEVREFASRFREAFRTGLPRNDRPDRRGRLRGGSVEGWRHPQRRCL
jgi:hypothetical protein